MSWKKVLSLAIVLVLAGSLLAGCAGGKKNEAALRWNLGTEPETLDSAKATGQPEFNVLNALFEGLARLDENLQPQPAMAESWDISPDNLVYTFHLRDGIKWSNGDPVTAEDFKYSWMRVLDPNTASDYAYQLWYIKGAEAYTNGEGTADQVGIEVPDAKTLKVTLTQPAPYFLSLMAFPTYFPVHRATVEAAPDKYGAEAANLVTNGPFKLDKWEHKSVLEMTPFEDYWDGSAVKLDKLVFYTVEEESTELAMYETGDLDILDNPPLEEMARLKNEGLQIADELSTYYYIFNCQKKPFDDARVRKAFTLAINRQQLIDSVTQAGQKPAMAMVPYGIPNPTTGQDFRTEGGDYFKDSDVATAKQLLAEAGYPDGKGLPPIEILTNDNEGHVKIAQAIMEMWKQNLGVENVSIRTEEWGVYLTSRDEGDFQIARAGWGADYIDPMTFLDMWLTGGGNNNTFWGDPEYDRLINETRASSDQKVRFENMHKAEDILMSAMPIAPIYFYTDPYMYQPYVKGVRKLPFGPTMEFKWASIEGKK